MSSGSSVYIIIFYNYYFVGKFSTIFGLVYLVYVQNSIRRVSIVKMFWGGRIIKRPFTLLQPGAHKIYATGTSCIKDWWRNLVIYRKYSPAKLASFLYICIFTIFEPKVVTISARNTII